MASQLPSVQVRRTGGHCLCVSKSQDRFVRYGEADWNHHAAAAAVAAAQFQPPSPAPDSETAGGHLYPSYKHPSLCPPLGDFKPPIFTDTRPIAGQEDRGEGGEALSRPHAGPPHHSPDSGLAASEGLSGSDSPAQPPSPSLPSRPQPARSPYEWMKRPSLSARPCKEGPEGKIFIQNYLNNIF